MYIKKVKYKNRTYYYLGRKISGSALEDRLATIGALDCPTSDEEIQLLTCWALRLLSGSDVAMQNCIEMGRAVTCSHHAENGKSFDLGKCLQELSAIYLKYGKISKLLLEKQARPSGELSWGTSTVLNQLRNRGLSLAQVFEMARGER